MLEQFKDYLKVRGQRVTRPRLAVFKYLETNDTATLREIISGLSPSVDRASIYRTTSLFLRLGIIHEIVAGGRRMIELTDRFDTHHHHLTCLNCGRHEYVEDATVEERLVEIARSCGFIPTSHLVEVNGLCRVCRG